MWQKFVLSAPSTHTTSLAITSWKDEVPPTVDEVIHHVHDYKESISTSLISAMKKLVQQLDEDISYSSPLWTPISAINRRHLSAQEGEYRRYVPWGTLCFYLQDHGEDMRRWDGKPASTLEAQGHGLKGKKRKNHEGVPLGRLLLQPLVSFPERVEKLTVLSVLWK